jgi:hypothetical protein
LPVEFGTEVCACALMQNKPKDRMDKDFIIEWATGLETLADPSMDADRQCLVTFDPVPNLLQFIR